MILSYGGVPYTDETYQSYFGGKFSSWPEVKASGELPFGQLPVLAVDGQLIGQSGAISRYCASLVPGLVPEDPLQCAMADSVFEAAQELAPVNPIINVYRGETWVEKKQFFFESTLPGKLENIARFIDSSGGPFTCGKQVATKHNCTPFSSRKETQNQNKNQATLFDDNPTLAQVRYCDFAVFHQCDLIRLLEPDHFAAYPSLANLMASVEGLPGVCDYLASRPDAIDIGTKPMLRDKATEPAAKQQKKIL